MSIFEVIRDQAVRQPEHVALEGADGSAMTYHALMESVSAMAGTLRADGVVATNRIALVLPNGPEMAVTLLGVASVAVAAPLNPLYTATEFASYLRQLALDGIMLAAGMDTPARSAATSLGLRIWEVRMGFPGAPRLVNSTAAAQQPVVANADQDKALVLLTSGSTGQPKRVPLTHRNLLTSVGEICASMRLAPEDRCLSMWEQFHVGGLVDLLLAPLASGGTVICGSRFDVNAFFHLLEARRPSWFQAVPATLHEVLAHARKLGATHVPSSLRLIRSVAAALPPAVKAEVEDRFRVPVIQTFGMTEAAPLITSTEPWGQPHKPGSLGKSFGTRVAIMDPGGRILDAGDMGEVVVRGDNVMAGYEEDDAANRLAFAHGWFHTGDLGLIDADGELFLKGRVRELINRGGEKVWPQEIDDVLATHPAIEQAVSFAIPHRVLGEDIAVAVVLKQKMTLSPVEVRGFVAARLSAFKVPQQVVFVDALPRGATGKVKRLELASQIRLPEAAAYLAPETETEATLAAIWAEELKVDRVGVGDDFFQLGGSSLSAVRLVAAVESALGRPLPPRALARMTTVRDMARFADDLRPEPVATTGGRPPPGAPQLDDATGRVLLSVLGGTGLRTVSDHPLILQLNEQASRPPLCWCFNGPGHEMKKLAGQLPADQPLFGMYSGSGQLKDTAEINRMVADFYAHELMALFPGQQLVLGGNCRGGGIAANIAMRLIYRGHPVRALILLDYFDPAAFAFPGPSLFMYGKQSHFRAHRQFRWGWPGWRTPFRGTPRVQWVPGEHGQFFTPEHLRVVGPAIAQFLEGSSRTPGLGERVSGMALRLIHASTPLFYQYLKLARLVNPHQKSHA